MFDSPYSRAIVVVSGIVIGAELLWISRYVHWLEVAAVASVVVVAILLLCGLVEVIARFFTWLDSRGGPPVRPA